MQTQILGIAIDRRSRRRGLVVVLYASYALLIACFALAERSGLGLMFAAGLLPSGLALISAFWALSQLALPYATEGTGRNAELVDERQLQVRDRAFYRAYQILSSLFGLWVVYEGIARTNERQWFWVPQTFGDYQAIVWGYLLVAMTLPSALIAWTEPDLSDSDDTQAGELRLAR